ncbi:RuBisCO large subunit C-terminal-like domain-containing protein [Georgenia muralis]
MTQQAQLVATYSVAVPGDPYTAASMLAGEQSAGTFTPVAGDSPELQETFGARVQSVRATGRTRVAARAYDREDQAEQVPEYEVRVAYPVTNLSLSASHLMTVVAGNLFELKALAGVRLEDIAVPEAVARAIRQVMPHGVRGSRRAMKRTEGPMLGTIVKPSIGLDNEQIAELTGVLAGAGLDLVKDDELNADLPHAPLLDRVDRVQAELKRRGSPGTQYAYNITGTVEHMKRAAEHIESRGGTTAMVVVPWIGLEAFAELRRHTSLVLQAHRAGWGALDRSADVGVSFRAYARVLRLLGADQVHVGGLRSKFWEHTASICGSVEALTAPDPVAPPALPVLSSAQTVLTAAESYQTLGTEDLLVLAGGGIHGHPDGPAAGVRSLRLAWDAAVSGIPLEDVAAGKPELARAVEHFSERG